MKHRFLDCEINLAARELTRGVFPTQLARVGLEPVLRTLVARTDPAPGLQVTDAVSARRFSPRVETAVYFCCAEAVRRGAGSITVAVAGDELVVELRGSCAAPDVASTVLDRVEDEGRIRRAVEDLLEPGLVAHCHASSGCVGAWELDAMPEGRRRCRRRPSPGRS